MDRFHQSGAISRAALIDAIREAKLELLSFSAGDGRHFWQLCWLHRTLSPYRMNEFLISIIHTCLVGLCAPHSQADYGKHTDTAWLSHGSRSLAPQKCSSLHSGHRATDAPALLLTAFVDPLWNFFCFSSLRVCSFMCIRAVHSDQTTHILSYNLSNLFIMTPRSYCQAFSGIRQL